MLLTVPGSSCKIRMPYRFCPFARFQILSKNVVVACTVFCYLISFPGIPFWPPSKKSSIARRRASFGAIALRSSGANA